MRPHSDLDSGIDPLNVVQEAGSGSPLAGLFLHVILLRQEALLGTRVVWDFITT